MAKSDSIDYINVPRSKADKIFDFFNYFVLTVILIIVMYPLYLIVISSISEPTAVTSGDVMFWPKGFTLEGYEMILKNKEVLTGYKNTIIYTSLNVLLGLLLLIPGGYALSRKDLVGRNVLTLLILFTMLFSGGIIPKYLIVKKLHMVDTMWAVFVPSAVSAYHLIITRTFFQSTIPEELLESAKVDGCSMTRFFLSIVIPLSIPIIAVMALFNAVSEWNSYFPALIFLQDQALYPLQLILRSILITSEQATQASDDGGIDPNAIVEAQRYASLIKYALIMVSSIPMLVLYPFLQRYFVKGVMIGSIKG